MRTLHTAIAVIAIAGFSGTATAQLAPGGYDRSQFSYGGFRGMGSGPIRSPQGGHSHGHGHHGHGHHHYFPGGYWGGYYGYPFINPPVYVFPPYGVSYGSFGYGTVLPPAVIDPVGSQIFERQLLQQQANDEWAELSARLADTAMRNQGDPTRATTAVPVPSSPEAKIRSLRYQAQGDEAFRNQEFHKAYDRYRLAANTARDSSGALLRTGYSLVALGRYSQAIEYFKRALRIDPSVVTAGPSPTELYGDNNLAWASHLSKVTAWVRDDVRDAQRVLLMGMLLKLDGDTRADEFLEKAWQLSGGTESTVVTLLNPPQVAPPEAAPLDNEAVTEVPADGPAPGEAASEEVTAPDAGQTAPPEPAPATQQQPGPALRPAWEQPVFPLPSQQSERPQVPPPPKPLPVD